MNCMIIADILAIVKMRSLLPSAHLTTYVAETYVADLLYSVLCNLTIRNMKRPIYGIIFVTAQLNLNWSWCLT